MESSRYLLVANRMFMRIFDILDRGVEQLVAHRAHNPEVAGSNPAPATIKGAGIDYSIPAPFFLCVLFIVKVL